MRNLFCYELLRYAFQAQSFSINIGYEFTYQFDIGINTSKLLKNVPNYLMKVLRPFFVL